MPEFAIDSHSVRFEENYSTRRSIFSNFFFFLERVGISYASFYPESFPLSFYLFLYFLSLSFSSLYISLFLSHCLSVSLLVFHAYARAHSGIPHRRNNYYYESDPGQETTIVSTFLLLLPTYSSPSPLLPTPRGPHTKFTGLVLFSPLVSNHLKATDGTLGGLLVVPTV